MADAIKGECRRDYRPFIETYTSEALPWALTQAVHSYDTVPEEADFPALLTEYAQAGR